MSVRRPDTDLTIPDRIGSPELPAHLRSGLTYGVELPGSECGFLEEQPGFEVFPEDYCRELLADPTRVRGSKRVDWQIDQNRHASCASASALNEILDVRRRENQRPVWFNWLYNYAQKDVGGGQDRGSSLAANLISIREDGCCPMSVRPFSRGIRAPTEEEREAARAYKGQEFFRLQTLGAFRTLLLSDIPVCAGYRGHAITFYELENYEQGIYDNTWGLDWGYKPHPDCKKEGGFGLLSLAKIYLPYGMYAILTTTDTRHLDESRFLQAV